MKKRILLSIAVAFIVFAGIIGCRAPAGKTESQHKLKVVTTLFPLYDFTKNVGGAFVDVVLLLPPGAEPHSFEPRPGDMLKIDSADMFVYTGETMEPWVGGVLKGIDNRDLLIIDASRGVHTMEESEDGVHGAHYGSQHVHGRIDPHIWLDFANAQKMVDNIANGLIAKDPGHRAFYAANAKAYNEKLKLLDGTYSEALGHCKRHTFIHGGHFAFNYLAKRYNLKYISAYAGSPDAEPTPKRLIELEKKMKELNITTIYYEELIMPRVAEVLARETGARLLKLNGAHNITSDEFRKGVTFLSLMEDNLRNLRKGLQCQ